MRYPIHSKSYKALYSAGRPKNPNEPEAYAHTLFDTQTYLDNTTTTLRFFASAQTSQTLGNLPQASQLPAGQYFAIERVMVTAWPDAGYVTTTAGGVAGIADDLGLLFYQGRPSLKLTYNNKPYGPWPARECLGNSGKIGAFGWGTFTAEESLQFAEVQGDGKYIGQSIVLLPLTAFHVDIDWGAAQNLTDDYRVTVSLVGTAYRQVV